MWSWMKDVEDEDEESETKKRAFSRPSCLLSYLLVESQPFRMRGMQPVKVSPGAYPNLLSEVFNLFE